MDKLFKKPFDKSDNLVNAEVTQYGAVRKMLRAKKPMIAYRRTVVGRGAYSATGDHDVLAFQVIDGRVVPLHYTYDEWLDKLAYYETVVLEGSCEWTVTNTTDKRVEQSKAFLKCRIKNIRG